jgi:predicted TIM-barrel fold metal-dependent hydrolase
MVRVDDQGVKEAGAAVDVHFHVFPAAGAQAPAAPASASAVRYRPAYGATLDTWSQAGAGHGVTHGVVVQPSFLGTDNGALLAALATMPGRLRGIAVVAPSTSCASMHALDALGVRGIRLNLVGRDHRLSGTERGLVERADSVGWQVEVHVERGRLPEVLAQLQDVRTVIVDHFGKPDGIDDTATWAAVERDAGRLHVKLSAPYRLGGVDPAALVARWLERVGPGRLLWGSDWPCTNHEAAAPAAHLTAPLRAWLQDEAIVRRVLFETPLALYRFDPPPG